MRKQRTRQDGVAGVDSRRVDKFQSKSVRNKSLHTARETAVPKNTENLQSRVSQIKRTAPQTRTKSARMLAGKRVATSRVRSNGKPNREPETLRGVTETPRKMANRRGPLKNQKPKIAAQRLSRKQRSSAARNSFFEKITHLSKDQITILVLALIVLALLAVFAFSYVKSQINEYRETKTAPAAAAKFTPIACTDENLELKLEVAARKGETGAVFNVLFRNPKTTAPCLIDAGYSNVKLNVVSGDAQVWNSQVCAAGVKNKQLLIGKGVTSKQGYIWNGVHAGSGCKGTSLAQPGTYRVQLSVAGKNVVDNYPFIINSNGTISIPAANAPAE